jgi:hypothetical protein
LVLLVTGARDAVLVGTLVAGAALVLAGAPDIVDAKGLPVTVTGTARLTGEPVAGPLVMGARLTGEPVAGARDNGTLVVGAAGARFCGEPGPILQSTSSNNKRRPVILAMWFGEDQGEPK